MLLDNITVYGRICNPARGVYYDKKIDQVILEKKNNSYQISYPKASVQRGSYYRISCQWPFSSPPGNIRKLLVSDISR